MQNKLALSSLAMDLKRVALGIHRKSYRTADQFLIEAIRRKNEINKEELLPYMQVMLENIEQLANMDNEQKSEDALLYSTRIQNYVLYKQ